MRILYLDLGMGIAGDMFSAALFDLLNEDQKQEYLKTVNSLGLDGVRVSAETVSSSGICGVHMRVLVHGQEEVGQDLHEKDQEIDRHEGHQLSQGADQHEDCQPEPETDRKGERLLEHRTHRSEHSHTHHGIGEIHHIVAGFDISEEVKSHILAIYEEIAKAESAVHGMPVEEIHFHEVGSLDAIVDVTSACLLMDMLAADRVTASPVRVGYGQVRAAHGLLPVPAPATALLLRGLPVYAGQIEGELCTPTGAAIIRHFVRDFGPMPAMRLSEIGYGIGGKKYTSLNAVRAFLGETDREGDRICELTCNLDDMTAERLGFAMDRLYAAGAVEVYMVPATMKKSRPGVVLVVLCQEEQRQALVESIFKYTTTLGIRESIQQRYILGRRIETVDTDLGPIRKKLALGYGVNRAKYEYDDLARIARERSCSIEDVIAGIKE